MTYWHGTTFQFGMTQQEKITSLYMQELFWHHAAEYNGQRVGEDMKKIVNVDRYKGAGTGDPVPPAESNRSVSILAPFPLDYLYAATNSPLKSS
jgi:hypothetical protein